MYSVFVSVTGLNVTRYSIGPLIGGDGPWSVRACVRSVHMCVSLECCWLSESKESNVASIVRGTWIAPEVR